MDPSRARPALQDAPSFFEKTVEDEREKKRNTRFFALKEDFLLIFLRQDLLLNEIDDLHQALRSVSFTCSIPSIQSRKKCQVTDSADID